MRKTAVLFSLLICLVVGAPTAQAGGVDVMAAINAAAAALDDAFERQDADDIKQMMTPDHVAVTPYYDGPQSVAEQIASLPELKYVQTIIGEPKITLLGADTGLRSFTADLDGTFKGKPIPKRVFVTSVMVNEGGRWHEAFYQVTAMQP